MKSPKVLIISANPLSDANNNGKTITSFFRDWEINQLCQLYFSLEDPSYSICKHFFRITDLEILKRFFRLNKSVGYRVHSSESVKEKKEKLKRNFIYRVIVSLFKKKSPIASFIRNVMWKEQYWINSDLVDWLDEQNPQLVFFQSGNIVSFYRIADWVCKYKDIPLIMQTTDDYLSGRFSVNPFFWINIKLLQKWYKRMVNKSKVIIAISDYMAVEYKHRFAGEYIVAMNSVKAINRFELLNNFSQPIQLLYAGNLGLNRWKQLVLIGKALGQLEMKYNIRGVLNICSLTELTHKMLQAFDSNPHIKFIGVLDSEQLQERIKASHILVHTEAFDRNNIYITRLSISTKISEYLLSCRAILAVGPANVASIRYLTDYNLATIVTEKRAEVICESIHKIISNKEYRNSLIYNSIKIGKQRHDSSIVQKEISNHIFNALKK